VSRTFGLSKLKEWLGYDRAETLQFVSGLSEPGMVIRATPLGPPGSVSKGVKAAKTAHSAYKGSAAFQVVRTVKRPITSTMTRLGFSSTPEKIVTRYGYAKYGVGLLDPLAATRALSRGDYDEAIIGFYGPPGSVHLYRKALESLASSSSPSQQNGGAKGKKSSSKNSKNSYKPHPNRVLAYYEGGSNRPVCRKGFRFERRRGLCVKK